MWLLTVGVGSLPGGAAAAKAGYATRGRRPDEAVDMPRLLWSGAGKGISYDRQFFCFRQVCSFPKPLDPGTLPFHVRGSSRAAARRAAKAAAPPAPDAHH